jgi:murein DD-endopeptidase MepM/ murein hydrolase activator NlpD
MGESGDRPPIRIEWWVRAVPLLGLLHLAYALTLYSRPGVAGVVLWHVGRPALTLLGAALLIPPLIGSLRRRQTWNRWRLAGLLAVGLLTGSLLAYRAYPSSYDDAPSQVRFRLPLDGPIRVAWGGPTRDVNYHVVAPGQRWAYDLLVTENHRSHRLDGAQLTDYHAYGRPVLAPAAGRVVVSVDGEPDSPPGGRRWTDLSPAGNHVILEVAPNEFLVIAHLRPGTVAVGVDQLVEQGERIGEVGNSGNSHEPHVHVHLQDSPEPRLGEGIPMYFHDYRHDGRFVERGVPEGGRWRGRWVGDVVEHAGADADGS